MMPGAFRQYVPDLKDPKWTGLAQRSALSHAQHLFDTVSLVRELDREWRRLYSEPFKGITTDGKTFMRPRTTWYLLLAQLLTVDGQAILYQAFTVPLMMRSI